MADFRSWYHTYINACNQKYTDYVENLKKSLEIEKAAFKKLVDYRMNTNLSQALNLDEKINQKNDQISSIEDKLAKISSVKEEMDSRSSDQSADKVYEKLKKHQKIDKIEIDGDDLNIITKKLKVQGHNIGHFKFTYNPKTNRLFIRNLEYVVEGIYDHWHVKVGDPCLSEWKPILWKYLDTFQIFFFVDTLIHYLLLSSSVHAYKPFEEWIKLFEQKAEVKKQEISANELSADQIAYAQMYQTVAIRESELSAGWVTTTTDVSNTTNSYYYWASGATTA